MFLSGICTSCATPMGRTHQKVYLFFLKIGEQTISSSWKLEAIFKRDQLWIMSLLTLIWCILLISSSWASLSIHKKTGNLSHNDNMLQWKNKKRKEKSTVGNQHYHTPSISLTKKVRLLFRPKSKYHLWLMQSDREGQYFQNLWIGCWKCQKHGWFDYSRRKGRKNYGALS